MIPDLRLTGAKVLRPGGLSDAPLSLANGRVADAGGREIDLSGYLVLPGIVDAHGDAFEKHLAPRRGAMKDLDQGLLAAEAEVAANGITTATLAQFYSWEGGMRGADFAHRVFAALDEVRPRLGTDLRVQLRFELSMVNDYDAVADMVDHFAIPYLVFNDHLPHVALAMGKRPPRLTGQALRIGKNPEKHLADLQALYAGLAAVPAALDCLIPRLAARGVLLGSHDDRSRDDRAGWRARGVRVAEFPETLEAAEAAKADGDPVVLGAPNLVRGGSHKGNVSALDLVAMGLCDALASDYHYPSTRRAAFLLADAGVLPFEGAWGLIADGPARMLGLKDRGRLEPGMRADVVVLDEVSRDICATFAGGQVTYMKGDVAARFLAR
ncbi:alpha-D-ribose 1-methylphosphonate 5-triphosphate diphosphatase [Roseovarius aestuariivivens]|uniref:alpha-D-ribose 1-methylphosphonate 5-triphosphate diphosphatase n=1 Tax=Roseovarius aestuariivivens TaxID=1888910 RepID=UPI001080E37B|nr:alpha-D-ribose 1-methylphosphonate 5-triphosphate diphosphatase [Roseovarius aestuariivivens]